MPMTTNTLRRRGFSLVDVIVSTALLLIVFLALFGVLRASLALSSLAKAKSAAIELASTQIEYLRGVSYDALGTVGGIPSGAIPQITTSTVDGVLYTTRTFVEYYDNPADGSGIQDTNGVTTDYKVGKVTISYTLHGLDKSVVLVSNFVPPTRTDVLDTIPPKEMTAISDVPPPISTIMCPDALPIGISAPIADAIGCLMMYAAFAPAASVASMTARRSVEVIPAGTAIMTSGLNK